MTQPHILMRDELPHGGHITTYQYSHPRRFGLSILKRNRRGDVISHKTNTLRGEREARRQHLEALATEKGLEEGSDQWETFIILRQLNLG